ncbi:hypothetical protein A2U01_0110576, partial [Trifolium medium]|nr:hypothetical protein [Trifolium medium]
RQARILSRQATFLIVAGRGGYMVASCRQMSPEKAKHSVDELLSVARRGWATGTMFLID